MKEGLVADENPLHRLKGHLVSLSGIDGTGKTSIAMKLKNELDSTGVTCDYVWFRNARFLSLQFLALCYLAGFAEIAMINGKRVGVYYFYKSNLVAHLWLWISAADMLVVSLWKIQLPLWRGNTVIADRYVIDALVDLVSDTGVTNLDICPYKLMLRLLDRRSSTVILTVDNDESLRRKDDSISSEYLIQRQQLYQSIAQELDIPTIDANPSFDIVWPQVVSALLRQIA